MLNTSLSCDQSDLLSDPKHADSNHDTTYDSEPKSPNNIYSTSPSSSFSCSSSNSSLFSLSNMGFLNNNEEKVDLDTSNTFESDKYKPEDIKRYKHFNLWKRFKLSSFYASIIFRNKMIHNILEKNRRAHLKDCFESLQYELPQYREKKVTNLLILKQTIKYVEVN